jgi:hypothetical protein
MHTSSEKSIDKEMPTFHVLRFIHEKILEITINLIQYQQNIVQVIGGYIQKTLIVEVDIGKLDVSFG